jgi:hypothetical protein
MKLFCNTNIFKLNDFLFENKLNDLKVYMIYILNV